MLKNTMSYKGKKVYIGMDVHKKTYAITAICDDVVVKRFSHVADPIVVSSILRKMFKGAQIFSVYEAGFSGFTLHRELEKVGIHNIVINPASVEVARHDRVKTDKKDSKKLAEHLAMGRLSSVHIPMLKEEAERSLTRTREQLVRNRVQVGNQIKMKLMFHGLLAHNDNRAMSKKFLASVLAMNIDENIRFAIETLVDTWLAISQQILKINKRIKEVLDTKPSISEIYRSVPGVGEISAGVLANELGDLKNRFRNQKAIYCFTGLTPSEYSSGDSTRKGRISRQGSGRLRHILTEVAWRAIKADKSLFEKFERIASTRGKRKAIVAIARNLIGRMRSCFVNETIYVLGM